MDDVGNLYVVGTTYGALPGQTNLGGGDAYLRKFDGNGNELWTRQFGTQQDDALRGVGVDGAGRVYVVGQTIGALPGQTAFSQEDAYVRKYDKDGNELWTRQFGTHLTDDALAMAIDGVGNFYVVGGTWGELPGQTNLGGRDAYVRKYDGDGNELWTRQFGTNSRDDATEVAVDGAGNVYVVGDIPAALPGQTNLGRYDAYLRKYDNEGRELWTRQFGSQHFDLAWDVAVDRTGKVYVAGWTRGPLPGQAHLGDFDAFVGSYDGDGNQLWFHQFGTSENEHARRVLVDRLGNLYLVGYTDGAFPGHASSRQGDAFVMKMSGVRLAAASAKATVTRTTAPDVAWTRQFGTQADDFAKDLVVDGAGNLYVVGYTLGVFPGQTDLMGQDAFLRKYDSDGNGIWTRQFGPQGYITALDVSVDNAGYLYVVGDTWGTLPGQSNFGQGDAYVIKYDNDGDQLWTDQFGTSGNDTAAHAAVDQSGNLYVSGETEGTLPGQTKYSQSGRDSYLVKYDSDGHRLWTRQFGVFDIQGRDTSALWVEVDKAGNVYVAGEAEAAFPGQTSQGAEDIFLRRYDSGGNELWTRQFGTQDHDRDPALAVDGVGNIYVVGRVDGAFAGQTNFRFA